MIVPVIIAGGKGLRLWPQSREMVPKPFVSVMGHGHTLLRSTFERLKSVPGLHAPLVVCNAAHSFLVQAQAISAGRTDVSLLLEPDGRNTAPALCAAALMIERLFGAEAIMLVLPADHLIADEAAFARAVDSGAKLAGQDYLVTFAMKPTSPATGYGYLKLGSAIDYGKQQFKLDAFVEKPNQENAQRFLASGQYAWNSGMFMFKAGTLLQSFETLQPEIFQACKAAMPAEKSSGLLLDQTAFSKAPAISIDYAIMEKASDVATVVADLGWSDVGDWYAVWQASDKDGAGVVARGNAHAIDCKDSIVQSHGPLVVGLGLNNMIVVGTKDAILVAPFSCAQDVKKVVDSLTVLGRSEATSAKKVFRPWGWYESLHLGPGFQVKEIAVKPGAKLSLQRHKFRAEHWVCVKGRGIVTRSDERIEFGVNGHVDIPLGAIHRLENPGSEMLHIIETRIGSYTGEDDIDSNQLEPV
jgi:mannose-1-phosphate guanylyltransferase / mannose-6-phosphate isomerase